MTKLSYIIFFTNGAPYMYGRSVWFHNHVKFARFVLLADSEEAHPIIWHLRLAVYYFGFTTASG